MHTASYGLQKSQGKKELEKPRSRWEEQGSNGTLTAMKHQIQIHSLLKEAFSIMDMTHKTRTRRKKRLKLGKMMGNYVNAAQFPVVGSRI
jgi:hypothetical protein